ncbi:MAG: hypothetical protein QXS37_03395, partial [Candidatus Aenigmatarchaeota archaeon]
MKSLGFQGSCKVKIVFLLLALISVSFASWFDLCKDNLLPKPTPTPIQIQKDQWFPVVIVAVFTGFLVIGIVYGLGKATGSRELIAWASNNVFQNFAILILVLLIYSYT